jgi:hypothetical protein
MMELSGIMILSIFPSKTDLDGMIFLPNTISGITYSPEQQKESLDKYIEHDGYLRAHVELMRNEMEAVLLLRVSSILRSGTISALNNMKCS